MRPRIQTLTSSIPDQIVFRPSDYAKALTSRDAGSRVRESLFKLLDQTPSTVVIRIVIDHNDLITPSFVDEFFGRVVSKLGFDVFRTRFVIDAGADENRAFINNVVRNRLLLDHGRVAS